MKVILLQELKGRGGEGDVIDVANGFAVNYLFPREIAIQATSGNLKQLEQRKHNIEKRELARTTDASTIFGAVNGKTVKVGAKVGEEGQLFGSITTTMIAEAIVEQCGVTVDRKKIDVHVAIKEAGEHEATVAIYRDVKASVTVLVYDEAAAAPVEETAVVEVAEEAAE